MDYLKEISGLTQTLSSVEEELKSEKSILEFILENTTDGYWDWDIKTNYEYLSPKFKFQLGYGVDEMENSPESWQRICNVEDIERTFKTVKSHFSGEIDDFSEILRFAHKNGHEVKVLCRGKVVKWGENGEPLRMIGTHTLI